MMASGRVVPSLVLLALCAGNTFAQDNIQKVNLTIYYEALCPDSQIFITNQVQKAYDLLSNYLILDLIPYGKASTHYIPPDKYRFRCQHGPNECLLNKLLSCGINFLKQPADQVLYNTCVMSEGMSALNLDSPCPSKAHMPLADNATACAYSTAGSVYLHQMGQRTPRRLEFVPRVDVNGVYKREDQSEILRDLSRYVCKQLGYPPPCSNIASSPNRLTPKWYDFLFLG